MAMIGTAFVLARMIVYSDGPVRANLSSPDWRATAAAI